MWSYLLIGLLGLGSGLLFGLRHYYRKWRKDLEEMKKVFNSLGLICQRILDVNEELRKIKINSLLDSNALSSKTSNFYNENAKFVDKIVKMESDVGEEKKEWIITI